MVELVDNLDGFYIGIVCGQNKITRELDVFLPKLMPSIPFNRDDIRLATNLGNNTIDIDYTETIVEGSTITVKPQYAERPLPKNGSTVLVWFLDGRIDGGYWQEFNPYNRYDILDDERYEEIFKVKIGEKEIDVFRGDTLEISLPDNFEANILTNDKHKNIIIKENDNAELENRISFLEKIIGIEGDKKTRSTGLFKKISKIEKLLKESTDSEEGE